MKTALNRHRRASMLGAALIAIAASAMPLHAADDMTSAEEEDQASRSPSTVIVTGERENYKASSSATATKLPMSLKETPQSLTVISRQQIEDFNLNTIADVLAQTPGITISSTDSNRTSFLSRGFAITNFQIDGVPTVWQTSGYANSAMSDMSIYERVEVVRGTAGLNAGTGDPSGTVNLVRKSPLGTFGASANLTGGSWEYLRGEVDVTGPIAANGAIRGRLVGAYTSRDSHVDFQHDKSPSLYGVIEADVTPSTTIRVGADYLETTSDGGAWSGVPLFFTDGTRAHLPRSYSAAADWNLWHRGMLNVFARVDQQLGGDWNARVSYNVRTIEAESRLFGGGAGFPSPDGSGMAFNRDTGAWETWSFYGENEQIEQAIDAYLSGSFNLFGRDHELVVGANHYKRDFTVFYSRFAPHDSPPFGNIFTWNGKTPEPTAIHSYNADWIDNARETGVYGALRLNPVDGVKLIVGGRYTDYRFYTENFTEAGVFENVTGRLSAKKFTPYGGIIVDVTPNISAFASYSQIFKAQNRLIAEGETAPPLSGTNYEAGLKGEFFDSKLYVALTGFHMEQTNALEADPDRPNPQQPGSFYYRVIPGVKTWGTDFEVTGEIVKGWNVSGGYTHSRSHNTTGRQFTTQPMHIARFNTTYQFDGALSALVIGGGLSWQSKIYNRANVPTGVVNSAGTPTLGSRQITQKAYMLANLMVRYKISDNIQVGANVTNLFDKWYFRNVGANGYYGEPRKFMVNARISFR